MQVIVYMLYDLVFYVVFLLILFPYVIVHCLEWSRHFFFNVLLVGPLVMQICYQVLQCYSQCYSYFCYLFGNPYNKNFI